MRTKPHNMKTIKDYIIVSSEDEDLFYTQIVPLSEDGYELYGNPFINKYVEEKREIIQFCQAMVKYNKDND